MMGPQMVWGSCFASRRARPPALLTLSVLLIAAKISKKRKKKTYTRRMILLSKCGHSNQWVHTNANDCLEVLQYYYLLFYMFSTVCTMLMWHVMLFTVHFHSWFMIILVSGGGWQAEDMRFPRDGISISPFLTAYLQQLIINTIKQWVCFLFYTV